MINVQAVKTWSRTWMTLRSNLNVCAFGPSLRASLKGVALVALCAGSLAALKDELRAESAALVQNPQAPPKEAVSIEIGQRFECQRDVRLEVYGCPILLREGTIGLRVSEAEFFIARGSLRVGALPPEPSIGFRRDPLKFRFFRGELIATGLEWLSVRASGELRWQKEVATGLSSISIDGVLCRAEENTMLVASRRQLMLFAPKDDQGFSAKDLEGSRLSELSLKHRKLRDAQASLTSRSLTEENMFPQDVRTWSREKTARRGRRYGVR